MPDQWRPDVYERFTVEHSQPFWDLAALLRGSGQGDVVDLGCGTGALTAELHRWLGARRTVGIDHSPAMLEKARRVDVEGLSFEQGDIAGFGGDRRFDVVFSNAALHWVPDHRGVLARWASTLAPAGQLAVQVPANADHPAHLLAAEVAAEEPFLEALGGSPPPDPVCSVLPPEGYSILLDELGFAEQHVRLQVYAYRLGSTEEVVDWMEGSSLNRFSSRMAPETFASYLGRLRHRLVERLGEQSPYLYPFKRTLMWGRLPV